MRIVQPKVTQAELARKYPTLLIADRVNFKLRYYQKLKLVKEYTVAVGAVGFDTPAGLYHIQNKAVNPAWNVPNSAWAGDLAGTVDPGRRGRKPDQGALAGHLRRRRHPRHRPDLLARQRRLPRLYPDGDPGRDRALRPGARRRARSTSPERRLRPDLARSGSPPSPRSSREVRRSVCRMQSVPMKTPRSRFRSTEYHMVDASLGPWIGCQGAAGLARRRPPAGIGQLIARGHPPVLGVDEERATPAEAMATA